MESVTFISFLLFKPLLLFKNLCVANHFFTQRSFNSLPPGQFGDQQPAIVKTWMNTQKLMNHIWRRLVKEYLPTFSRRSIWSNSNDQPLKNDDIVWMLTGQTPRGIWLLEKVMETTPG